MAQVLDFRLLMRRLSSIGVRRIPYAGFELIEYNIKTLETNLIRVKMYFGNILQSLSLGIIKRIV